MGAGCSTSAETKYRHLRNYLTSKTCLTFTTLETFVSIDNGPPLILLGENHGGSESDSMVVRCVTVFTAMKLIVSKCSEPVSKIHFIMEAPWYELQHPPNLNNKYHLRAKKNEDNNKTEIQQFRVKFNLGDVWQKQRTHASQYSDGFRVVPFDIFHNLRVLYTVKNHKINDEFTFEFVHMGTKQTVGPSLKLLGFQEEKILDLFQRVDSAMETQVDTHRESVEVYIAQENAENESSWEICKDEIMADKVTQELYPGFCSRPLVVHFWMFQIACWVYNLVIHVAEEIDYQDKFDNDVVFVKNKVEKDFKVVRLFPGNDKMFSFISTCGDYITYLVYMRKLLHERDTNNIYVIYGGNSHVKNFSDLMNRSQTHEQDLLRVANSV